MTNWKSLIIHFDASIRDAMRVINDAALRIGTVTDGDIRRGLLVDCEMQDAVMKVMNKEPTSAKITDSRQQCLKLMNTYDLLSLPIVDSNGYVVGLETLHLAMQPTRRDNPVFIMAEGFGTRLQPLTGNCPKPSYVWATNPCQSMLSTSLLVWAFTIFIFLPILCQSK